MVLGAVLGVVGVGVSVLLIYLGCDRRSSSRGAPAEASFVPCSDCGGEVRRGRRQCPWCGASLITLELVESSGETLRAAPGAVDEFAWEEPALERRRAA